MKRPHFTVTDRFMAMVHAGIFAKALHGVANTEPTALVRNGELLMDAAAWDAELSWDQWLQDLPPVDGWKSTASWMAKHGMGGAR